MQTLFFIGPQHRNKQAYFYLASCPVKVLHLRWTTLTWARDTRHGAQCSLRAAPHQEPQIMTRSREMTARCSLDACLHRRLLVRIQTISRPQIQSPRKDHYFAALISIQGRKHASRPELQARLNAKPAARHRIRQTTSAAPRRRILPRDPSACLVLNPLRATHCIVASLPMLLSAPITANAECTTLPLETSSTPLIQRQYYRIAL
jgi:hypothetical protein